MCTGMGVHTIPCHLFRPGRVTLSGEPKPVDGARSRSIVRASPSRARPREHSRVFALLPCAGFLLVPLRCIGLLSRRTRKKKMAGITTGIGWPVTRRLQQQQEMSTWWWWWTCLSWGPLFWTAVNFWHGDTVLQMIERCCEHKHSKYRQPSPRRARMLQSNTVSTNEIEIQRSETLNPAVSIPWSKSVLARLNKGSVPLQDSVP
jgi:hypothetical protein